MALSAKAQLFNSVEVSTGVSLATQTSAYKNKNRSLRETVRPGFNVMVRMAGRINKLFSYTSDLGYVQKGYRYVSVNYFGFGRSVSTEREQLIHYITYSPQLKFGRQTGNFIPSIILGPRIDYQVGYEGKINIDNTAHFFNKTIFGINTGLDVTYVVGNWGLTALFLYHADISKLYPVYNSTDLTYRNRAMIINLGVVYVLN